MIPLYPFEVGKEWLHDFPVFFCIHKKNPFQVVTRAGNYFSTIDSTTASQLFRVPQNSVSRRSSAAVLGTIVPY